MKTLQIYPTSRAIRMAQARYMDTDMLMPQMMRMDELEQRLVVINDRSMVDPQKRKLLLRQAGNDEIFGELRMDRSLVKFLSHSDGFFRFFEELAVEGVSVDMLAPADVYDEFGKHLDVLVTLRNRYKKLLDERRLTDRMFVPESYSFQDSFVALYDRIDIYVEGMLSRFELDLLTKISHYTKLYVHYQSSTFSAKMDERWHSLGIETKLGATHTIDWSLKRSVETSIHDHNPSIDVIAVTERMEQIAAAMGAIEMMVDGGIEPSCIVLVLPDESFKEMFRLYDKLNNLNFAMGFDYANGRNYKLLNLLSRYINTREHELKERLDRYDSDGTIAALIAQIRNNPNEPNGDDNDSSLINIEQFWSQLDSLGLRESDPLRQARVAEAMDEFGVVFADERLSMGEWLHIWLMRLSEIRIDDLRGGMITVMGVLETRGVSYDGVVIVDFNEGIVPATTSKDQFLNTQVRAFASLPTKSDRESLQKHYYHMLISRAQKATIIYATSDNKLPSRFLYQLRLDDAEITPMPLSMLYDQDTKLIEDTDPIVRDFEPTAQRWSATRLTTWLGCKRKYYYRYIRNIQPKPDDTINEGALLHTMLERLYRYRDHYTQARDISIEIDRILDEIMAGSDAQSEYHQIVWRAKLKPFVEHEVSHFADGWRVIERESEYRSMIYGLEFGGRIDRIDIADTQTLVIDYKTGQLTEANRSKHLENTVDFQMNIYRHLLQNKYPNSRYVFQQIIDDGKYVEAVAMDDKEQYLKEHLADLARRREFVATKTDQLSRCRYCDYRLICGRGEYI